MLSAAVSRCHRISESASSSAFDIESLSTSIAERLALSNRCVYSINAASPLVFTSSKIAETIGFTLSISVSRSRRLSSSESVSCVWCFFSMSSPACYVLYQPKKTGRFESSTGRLIWRYGIPAISAITRSRSSCAVSSTFWDSERIVTLSTPLSSSLSPITTT